MDLSQRKREILRLVTDAFIATGEPVGSKAVMENMRKACSSATIRNEMNDLEKLGLWATRLSFTTENSWEVDRILADYIAPPPFDPGACTRGLYLRGLD